ncbi:hypothetical protein SeLEV6574_g06073 [Synchytrium endobioticum]|uniref:ABC transporter domain-containing protein n=1 Tax=Synchytrium endobioticum TaxID=286115 RepID=A0A507CQM6_9FUNG|nr:hypothetical protein SeLEV6574_g06073 [Synchytrium endobioticum]
MEASGAGKTSLLQVLAGEARSGEVQGQILINGQEVLTNEIKRCSGFVFQDDVILSTMTVREAITKLRNGRATSILQKTLAEDTCGAQILQVVRQRGMPTANGFGRR